MNYQDAVKTGAMAVFDEKYEDTVRVVSVRGFSKELCGGTHVAASTGQIGLFKIMREASPGAGMRRIEAVTLKGVLDRYNSHEESLSELAEDRQCHRIAPGEAGRRTGETEPRAGKRDRENEKGHALHRV